LINAHQHTSTPSLHDALPILLDADTESDTPWLASLYIPGPSLSDVLDVAGPLDVAGVHYLAVPLAVALTDLHRAGLIHRDLKPGDRKSTRLNSSHGKISYSVF